MDPWRGHSSAAESIRLSESNMHILSYAQHVRTLSATSGNAVPATAAWLHEVKYDGYRLIVQRDDNRVRLITRGGHDWSSRFPRIVETALLNRHKRFVIDGEAVVLDGDGIADFNALHSRRHDDKVWLYAFDVLAADGEDLRGLVVLDLD